MIVPAPITYDAAVERAGSKQYEVTISAITCLHTCPTWRGSALTGTVPSVLTLAN